VYTFVNAFVFEFVCMCVLVLCVCVRVCVPGFGREASGLQTGFGFHRTPISIHSFRD